MQNLRILNIKVQKTTEKDMQDKEGNNDEALLREAMINAYSLIVGVVTYEDFLKENDTAGMWLPADFNDDVAAIDRVIEYFISTEEYEKCADLAEKKEEIAAKGVNDELTKLLNNTEWKN